MGHFVAALDSAEVAEGRSSIVRLEGEVIALFRVEGRVYAIDNACPHAGGPLGAGHLDGKTVLCPLHLWCFDLESGESLDVPGTRVRTYPVQERDGVIEIELEA